MHEFFGHQFSQENTSQQFSQQQYQRDGSGAAAMSTAAMLVPPSQHNEQVDMANMLDPMDGGDTLDEIVRQNSKELLRRRSLPLQEYAGDLDDDDIYNSIQDRRGSMIEINTNRGYFDNYQFGTSNQSTDLLAHNTRATSRQGQDMSRDYEDMMANVDMGVNPTSFSPMNQIPLTIDPSSAYQAMSQDVSTNMIPGMMPYSMTRIQDDQSPINIFDSNSFIHPFQGPPIEPIPPGYALPLGTMPRANSGSSIGALDRDISGNETPLVEQCGASRRNSSYTGLSSSLSTSPISFAAAPSIGSVPTKIHPIDSYSAAPPSLKTAGEIGIGMPMGLSTSTNFTSDLSTSGFDVQGVLMRVASRSNPEIDLGPVDMSCAFVICDMTLPDNPIIFVSEIFERLTGYNTGEVLMQNCRFLQSPDGKVTKGVKRKFVDDRAVYALKLGIKNRREVQCSLINYRKGGQAFTNLLSMIPITWDTDIVKYYVGFQIDVVACPGAVGRKRAKGTYSVNYSQSSLPQYIWHTPALEQTSTTQEQIISGDDVSSLLASYPSGLDSELSRETWDRLLLQNSNDVIHVLSLKGQFLYVSPSSRHVLEYDASELVGMSLSSVCHPSDIIPVTRELKDASNGGDVSIVFRIRRKNSGYMWFESHGSVGTDQDGSKKFIVLVGRERPVYTLSRDDINKAGGIGDNEVWSKLSTSGMYLFISSHVKVLLDRQPEDLVGTSFQALMRPESRAGFSNCLELLRSSQMVTYKHEISNKRGLFLPAQTTLYPGTASEGQKQTFYIAQTRILRAAPRAPIPQVGTISKTIPNQKDEPPNPITYTTQSQSQSQPPLPPGRNENHTSPSQPPSSPTPTPLFAELHPTRCTSWPTELRQLQRTNQVLADELAALLATKKKRKRRKGGMGSSGGAGGGVAQERNCVNCHVKTTPEWRRGPSGQRDLCNSCGLRWAKMVSRRGAGVGAGGGGGGGGARERGLEGLGAMGGMGAMGASASGGIGARGSGGVG